MKVVKKIMRLQNTENYAMRFVTSKEDIIENIKSIDKYLNDSNHSEFAIKLIKRGTCFVVVGDTKLKFYPSRYIGYKNNNHDAHIRNNEKDGRETNPAISRIIGHTPEISETLEMEYKKYCESLGFTANKSGNYGAPRKYWRL